MSRRAVVSRRTRMRWWLHRLWCRKPFRRTACRRWWMHL